MVMLNFPEIGNFTQLSSFLMFAFLGIFSGIPPPRLVIDPPDFVTEFTPETSATARGGTRPMGAF